MDMDQINNQELRKFAGSLAAGLQLIITNPADAVFVLALVIAYFLNTQREDNVSLSEAQQAVVDTIMLLSNAGEGKGHVLNRSGPSAQDRIN